MSMHKADQKGMNTPYDNAFKSIIQKCPRLILFLINEMFYKNGLIEKPYKGNEKIELLNRELTDLEFGNLEEDLRLKVGTNDHEIFHMECESSAGDTRIMLRMIRYDNRSALEGAEIADGIIRVRIDDSGVLFLRSKKNTPDIVTVVLEGPQNSTMSYQIPALRLQDYTLDRMLENKLFVLLPFLFFNEEKQIERTPFDQKAYENVNTLFDDVIGKLKNLEKQGILDSYEASTLYDALKIVLVALGEKNKAEKEVSTIMGGTVLEFSADKYYNAGKDAGIAKTREEDILEKANAIIRQTRKYRAADEEVISSLMEECSWNYETARKYLSEFDNSIAMA